jgi:hypothetical protein
LQSCFDHIDRYLIMQLLFEHTSILLQLLLLHTVVV